MSTKLAAALNSVDWNGNIQEFVSEPLSAARLESCNLRLAVWSKQLEMCDKLNPALSFTREMQHAGHNVACCLALALYKPGAAAMRTVLECALYFTFFRQHPAELATLVRDDKYYVSKRDILEFYARHIPSFTVLQAKIGLVGRLESWYSKTSAIVHGQVPGIWVNGSSVKEFVKSPKLLGIALDHFEEGVGIVQDIFLCTLAQEHWASFDQGAKKIILKGLSGELKAGLGLDSA